MISYNKTLLPLQSGSKVYFTTPDGPPGAPTKVQYMVLGKATYSTYDVEVKWSRPITNSADVEGEFIVSLKYKNVLRHYMYVAT